MRQLFFVVLIAIQLAIASAAEAKRLWTTRDSAEIASFTPATSHDLFTYSPDNTKCCVVTSKGLVDTDEIESTIWLFDMQKVKQYLSASQNMDSAACREPLVRLAAATAEDAQSQPATISNLVWSAEGNKLYFLVRGKQFQNELYSVDLSTHKLVRLSKDDQDIQFMQPTDDGIVFTFRKTTDRESMYQAAGAELPGVVVGTGKSLFDLLFPNCQNGSRLAPLSVAHYTGDTLSIIKDATTGGDFTFRSGSSFAFLSPDRKYLAYSAFADKSLKAWQSYEVKNPNPVSVFKECDYDDKTALDWMRPEQYKILELATGEVIPLLNSPRARTAGYHYDDFFPVSWAPDSKTVAVSNTFFPLDPTNTNSPLRPVVASYDVGTKKCQVVSERPADRPGHLYYVRWTNSKTLNLKYGDKPESYDLQNGSWQRNSSATDLIARDKSAPALSLSSEFNSPPVISGEDHQFKDRIIKKLILDPNPQLAEIDRGDASIITWKDKYGSEWKGGLIKPANYDRNKKYPLLIQTHGLSELSFFADGMWTTASPGRALAAREFLVLQCDDHNTARETVDETEKDGSAGYISAIENLAAQGLIEPHRVGIVAFSHTGTYVIDCLIKHPEYFKAATLADSDSLSMTEFLNNADYMNADRVKFMTSRFACAPIGKDVQTWVEKSPGFNTDKIKCPVLFESHDPLSLVYGWDIYPAMRLQKKPVELYYFRSGGHVLSKPKQRVLSQETNADWFDFWLNKHEDSNPEKTEQYKRWRILREQQAEE